ncbi:MAG: PepSY domain-containing protein [Gammaproteobacteria bacterium]
MTRHPKPKSRAKLLRSLYIWHRYLGLAAAAFVILLALTGLALNHTEELGLDTAHVQSDLLLDWYGIHAPANLKSFRAGPHHITAAGDHVYWNSTRLERISPPLLGALAFSDLIVIGTEGQLLLFTPQGELIERLDGAAGVPAGMRALGLAADGRLAIRAAHGDYLTDENFLEWQESAAPDVDWIEPEDPPAALQQAIRAAYRGSDLSLERVVLDLHSGRILGGRGVYLVDAAAILFLVLAGSGVWLWSRRRASARAHRRGNR